MQGDTVTQARDSVPRNPCYTANRTAETITTQPTSGNASTLSKAYSYDGRNQLTGITDAAAGNTALSYDNQGNLTSKTQGSDITRYTYNARDNLIQVSKNATTLGAYSNDHLGLRIEKEAVDPLQPGAPPIKTRTLWEGRNAFQDSDTSGSVISRYETDGRRPVSMWNKDDGIQALHQDALGSIVATTDSAGNLKSETIYDAFGNVTETTGQSANKFGYTGHQMDKETGLIYFQARYYDPQLGRFITQDPFEGDWKTPLSLHHYLYAYGNPTVYVDLYGYASVCASDPCPFFKEEAKAPQRRRPSLEDLNAQEKNKPKREANNADQARAAAPVITKQSDKVEMGAEEKEYNDNVRAKQLEVVEKGKKAGEILYDVADAANPLTPEGLMVGPAIGGTMKVAKKLAPFLKEAAKDALKARKAAKAEAKVAEESVAAGGGASKAVKPRDTGTYGDLKKNKKKHGETELLDMDHQPSFASQVAAEEAALGRKLTRPERAAVKANSPAVASPRAVHQKTSPTYGARNTPARIAADAADRTKAAARDRAAFDKAMENR